MCLLPCGIYVILRNKINGIIQRPYNFLIFIYWYSLQYIPGKQLSKIGNDTKCNLYLYICFHELACFNFQPYQIAIKWGHTNDNMSYKTWNITEKPIQTYLIKIVTVEYGWILLNWYITVIIFVSHANVRYFLGIENILGYINI